MKRLCLVTGASGLLGSHLVEQLLERGLSVRAFVRPTSDTSFLKTTGAELVVGDLVDRNSIRSALAGVTTVYHSAAFVSDWGRRESFEEGIVTTTENIVEACREAEVERFLHVSSISVYGNPSPDRYPIQESAELGQNLGRWDHYSRSKIEAERLARTLGERATVVRPSWIYGPRDRITIPRVVRSLRLGKVKVIGDGSNLLNLVYAGDVAKGSIEAAHSERSRGEAYNLCSEGEVTQRKLLDSLCRSLDVPVVRRQVPFRLALWVATLQEMTGRLLRWENPPTLTRKVIYMIARPAEFRIDKAREHFGWRPFTPVEKGVEESLEWYLGSERASVAATG